MGEAEATTVPLWRMIKTATRELQYRERIYPTLVKKGRMERRVALQEIAAMKAILAFLRTLEGDCHADQSF